MAAMLPTPAPFVFGGTFSDYVKERHKFRRFSTLASLSKATHQQKDEQPPTRDEEIKRLYAEARHEGIGTVSATQNLLDVISIVNLADVAQHIGRELGLHCQAAYDAYWEELTSEQQAAAHICGWTQEIWDANDTPSPLNDQYWEEIPEAQRKALEVLDYCQTTWDEVEEADGEESLNDESSEESIVDSLKTDGAYDSESTRDSISSAGAGLEAPRPVVYKGTFEDYKNDAFKFTKFRTLGGFCDKASSKEEEPISDTLEEASETLVASTVIDGSCPQGCVPCQLLAMAKPPSMQGAGSLFATLSDATVKKMMASTMAGAKAAAKRAAALGEDLDFVMSKPAMQSSDPLPDNTAAAGSARNVVMKSKSARRFQFEEDDLECFATFGAMPMKKNGFTNNFRDDGSNWIVDDSRACGSLKPRSTRCSGSSWGGGGTTLEPICQGKFAYDQPLKVVLPDLPEPRAYMPANHHQESHSLRFGLAHSASYAF